MGRKFMQHVFTLIALLGIAAALFLGYKLVKKELDYRKGQEAHPYVKFDTLAETGTYQVIAAFKQPASRLDEDFKTMLLAKDEEQYEKLMNYLKIHRFYDTGAEAVWPDRLITLTTCEYTQKDGRFFVVAKRVES